MGKIEFYIDPEIIVEVLATITSIIGIHLITIPKRLGLWFLVIGQIFWMVFAYMNDQKFFLFQGLIFLVYNLVAAYNWKRKGVG